MKWNKQNFWLYSLLFLAGCFCCYLTLQWPLLNISTEINVSEILASVASTIAAIYIAVTIQRRLTRNQNQYTFIGNKLDTLWTFYSQYANHFNVSTEIDLNTVNSSHKKMTIDLDFLKNLFSAYRLDDSNIVELSDSLDLFQTLLEGQPIAQNIINYSGLQSIVESKVKAIHQTFGKILEQVHNI